MSEARVYVGNLPGDVRKEELERLFDKYGPIRALDIKLPPGSSRGSAFAFIEFESSRDAGDAVDGRDGMEWGGGRLKVQRAKGGYVSSGSRGPPRRSGFRVRVTGLPEGSSWQDLKDHMRDAGDVGFSNIERGRDGLAGVVEYATQEDAERAVARLDRSEMKSHTGDRAEVRVEEDREPAAAPRGGRDYDDRDHRPRYDDRDHRRGGGGRYDDRDRRDRRSPSRERYGGGGGRGGDYDRRRGSPERDRRFDDRDDRDRRFDDREPARDDREREREPRGEPEAVPRAAAGDDYRA